MEEVSNASDARPRKGRSKKTLLIVGLVLIIAAIVAYFICGITHKEGTYSGVLTRVEKTGILFKTYEGEMRITGIQEGQDTITRDQNFLFSVERDDVYRELEPLQGQRITVRFRQVLNNFFWQGKTDYFVEEVVEPTE